MSTNLPKIGKDIANIMSKMNKEKKGQIRNHLINIRMEFFIGSIRIVCGTYSSILAKKNFLNRKSVKSVKRKVVSFFASI